MSYTNDDFGFSRADVSRVASRQLKVSAVLLAIVGFATLGATFAVGSPQTDAASLQRIAPASAVGQAGGASLVRPG